MPGLGDRVLSAGISGYDGAGPLVKLRWSSKRLIPCIIHLRRRLNPSAADICCRPARLARWACGRNWQLFILH